MSQRQSWADDSGAKCNEGGGWPQRWTFDRNCLDLHVFEMRIQPGAANSPKQPLNSCATFAVQASSARFPVLGSLLGSCAFCVSKARQESFRTEELEAHVCCCCETHVKFVFCAATADWPSRGKANTFVSSINQHYCPLVLQEVELALFFEVRNQHFCQVPQEHRRCLLCKMHEACTCSIFQ